MPSTTTTAMTRREVLVRFAALGSLAQGEETLPWSDLPEAPESRAGVRFTDLSSLENAIVPIESFFVLQHGAIPRLRRSVWRLQIVGEVNETNVLDMDAIEALPRKTSAVCFECAGNGGTGAHGLVGNAKWSGVPLASLLERSGLKSSAREVVFYGADKAEERLRENRYPSRFARSLPIADALDDDVLLAYEMNGEPLPVEHGAPLRLIVPGWYGIAQVKWLTRIEIIDDRFMGWFMAKDYVSVRGVETSTGIEHRATSVGRQKLKSVITRVTRRRGSSSYTIHGLAWNDGTPILGVDVGIDDGPLSPARLEESVERFAWTPFHMAWPDASPGRHRLVSRARDADGLQPTSDEASLYKATPWENNGQVVREIEIPG